MIRDHGSHQRAVKTASGGRRIQMHIHFKMQCDWKNQLKLHKEIRPKIREWRKREPPLIIGAELTPHANNGYLSAILNLPHIDAPLERRPELPRELIDQIPEEIMQHIEGVCSENVIKLEILDHEAEMKKGKESQGDSYYCGRPFSEILRWGSFGTELALEILSILESNRNHWKTDAELRSYILSGIDSEFGADYKFKECVWHFLCVPPWSSAVVLSYTSNRRGAELSREHEFKCGSFSAQNQGQNARLEPAGEE